MGNVEMDIVTVPIVRGSEDSGWTRRTLRGGHEAEVMRVGL